MGVKKIVRNINLLNIALLAAAAFLAAYELSPLMSVKVRYTLPAAKEIPVVQEQSASQPELPSITEYAMISEENLFHPERRIPPEKKEEQPLPKPEFVLYGTLISDDLRLAYLEDLKAPRSSTGRGKRQTALKKGDTMGGFTLKEIETDKIVMVRGEEKIVVPINDPAHPKERKESAVTTASAEPAQAAASGKASASVTPQRKRAPGASFGSDFRQPRPSQQRQPRSSPTPQRSTSSQTPQVPPAVVSGSDIKTAPVYPPPVTSGTSGGGGLLGIGR